MEIKIPFCAHLYDYDLLNILSLSIVLYMLLLTVSFCLLINPYSYYSFTLLPFWITWVDFSDCSPILIVSLKVVVSISRRCQLWGSVAAKHAEVCPLCNVVKIFMVWYQQELAPLWYCYDIGSVWDFQFTLTVLCLTKTFVLSKFMNIEGVFILKSIFSTSRK